MVAWMHTSVQFVLMLAKRCFVDEIEMVILDWIIWILQFAFAACVFFSFSDWFFDEEYAVD